MQAQPGTRSRKLVLRNVGLMLSGDLATPILDADTIVAVDGIISAIGRGSALDVAEADTLIDAKGCAVAPGLIDSHVHPVFGDWTPRQNQLGGAIFGGFTPMIGVVLSEHYQGQWLPLAIFYSLLAGISFFAILLLDRTSLRPVQEFAARSLTPSASTNSSPIRR